MKSHTKAIFISCSVNKIPRLKQEKGIDHLIHQTQEHRIMKSLRHFSSKDCLDSRLVDSITYVEWKVSDRSAGSTRI